jgi:hypothetical protein
MSGTRGGMGTTVSIRKIPPAPRSLPLVFRLAGRAGTEREIVRPSELWTG